MQSYWFSKQSKINIIYNISVITITITMSIILANFGKYAISDCLFISIVNWLLIYLIHCYVANGNTSLKLVIFECYQKDDRERSYTHTHIKAHTHTHDIYIYIYIYTHIYIYIHTHIYIYIYIYIYAYIYIYIYAVIYPYISTICPVRNHDLLSITPKILRPCLPSGWASYRKSRSSEIRV